MACASKPMIYARYPTKEIVFAGVVERNAARVAGRFDGHIPDGETLKEKLVHTASHVVSDFDFEAQPSLDPRQIRDLAASRYIANGENVLLLGPPFGHRARPRGDPGRIPAQFTTATALVASLVKAQTDRLLEERLSALSKPRLVHPELTPGDNEELPPPLLGFWLVQEWQRVAGSGEGGGLSRLFAPRQVGQLGTIAAPSRGWGADAGGR